MNESVVALPTWPQYSPDTCAFERRAAHLNELIDAKCNFVMESTRLQEVAATHPEMRERCSGLITTLATHIETLQVQIDREMQGLLYSLQKSPAPSEVMDSLPG